MSKIFSIKNVKYTIILGILFILTNTFFGTAFDTTTKYVNELDIKWFHYYGIGNGFGLIIFLVYLLLKKKLKQTIVLKNKSSYLIPVLRGLGFIPIPLIVFSTLEKIDISVFTTILMTTPFFLYFWSKVIQNEKININIIILTIIGFAGVVIIIKPALKDFTITILICFIVPIFNSLASIIVSKYSKVASSDTYVLFFILPLIFLSLILCIINPIKLSFSSLFIICLGGTFLILAILFFTLAFHVAGNFSRLISPFLYFQILWALLSGYYFFGETIDLLTIIGVILVIFSGSLVLLNINSIVGKN